MEKRSIQVIVGLFMLLGAIGFAILAVQVSGLSIRDGDNYYKVYADFDNIGSLKVRQPVRVAGVSIGQIAEIDLNQKQFTARVTLSINKSFKLPKDSQAMIMTEGVLGAQYISFSPGFEDESLKDGDHVVETHSALILEEAIGKFLFNAGEES